MGKLKIGAILLFAFFVACNTKQEEEPIEGEWIKGTTADQLKMIEKQFRGFDHAMVEVGYRYQELYWAGQDENWDYAKYQIEKIQLALENGLIRRPKRATSAAYFVSNVLPEMQATVENKSKASFNQQFLSLTTNCNNCHAMENVSFFNVKIPEERQSPIRK